MISKKLSGNAELNKSAQRRRGKGPANSSAHSGLSLFTTHSMAPLRLCALLLKLTFQTVSKSAHINRTTKLPDVQSHVQ